jgi:hypothetical protein
VYVTKRLPSDRVDTYGTTYASFPRFLDSHHDRTSGRCKSQEGFGHSTVLAQIHAITGA